MRILPDFCQPGSFGAKQRVPLDQLAKGLGGLDCIDGGMASWDCLDLLEHNKYGTR